MYLIAGYLYPAADVTQSAAPAKAADTGPVTRAEAFVAGAKPAPGDTLVWDTGAPAQAVTPLAADLRVAGITIGQPAGKVTFDASHKVSLGLKGLDLGNATQDLEFQGPVTVELAQSWTVAEGRQVKVSGLLNRAPGATLDFRLTPNAQVLIPSATKGDILTARNAPFATYNGQDFAAIDAEGRVVPGSTVLA